MAQGDDAVAWARAQIGKPYVWATAGPDTFDCSGLVYAAYRAIKPPVYLGRTTYDQIFYGKSVPKEQLAVGDLVFPYSDISHVQLYSGSGNVIEAPNKDIPVRETRLTTVFAARRVAKVSGDDSGFQLPSMNPLEPFGIDPLDPFGIRDDAEAAAKAAVAVPLFTVKFLSTITSRTFWLRVGTVSLGGALIIWGISFLNRGLFVNTYSNIKQAGSGLLGGAVQGASFGVGAGAAGGLGGSTPAIAAPRTPKAPPAIAPSTAPVSPYRTTATVRRYAQPLPNPGGISNAEFIDRYAFRFGKTPTGKRRHNPPVSKGGEV